MTGILSCAEVDLGDPAAAAVVVAADLGRRYQITLLLVEDF